ncbi:hypothetical protein AXFE_27720 [Acidithrix ferrooxidans]|uniref:Uncharacterized protein n=1 Tax=Acidithrix ferrooxidans TaxID=1280514 RepID=A0A0D8HEM8_9ACTN|nr:hypothetical protein AXFE_27720 [Acidithrix ferrooxidans]
MSAPIARVIKSSKFSHAIFLAPGDLLLPSVLAMNDLSSIQGLGIFFPKGYVNTLKLEFGNILIKFRKQEPFWNQIRGVADVETQTHMY